MLAKYEQFLYLEVPNHLKLPRSYQLDRKVYISQHPTKRAWQKHVIHFLPCSLHTMSKQQVLRHCRVFPLVASHQVKDYTSKGACDFHTTLLRKAKRELAWLNDIPRIHVINKESNNSNVKSDLTNENVLNIKRTKVYNFSNFFKITESLYSLKGRLLNP